MFRYLGLLVFLFGLANNAAYSTGGPGLCSAEHTACIRACPPMVNNTSMNVWLIVQ
jgi:hypothetical protein